MNDTRIAHRDRCDAQDPSMETCASRVRADKALREMLTLNETTAEWMESSADALLRDTAAAYRQQSFGAGAILEASIRRCAPDLLNDIALVDALRTLRHNRMQRLIASDFKERQKYDRAISATIARIAHQIDLRGQPTKR
ncbi:MAG: hypothetical protein EXS15_08635 [Phycisphaerales bacterium]|nr:hypothetical protein [Phycisphaerales bacterium]